MAGAGRGSEGSDGYPDPIAMVAAVRPSSELEGTARSLERVCRAAVENLRLLGAAVRLLPQDGSAGVIIAAEGTGERLGDIEFNVGEGPATTAYTSSRPALVPDLEGADGNDWPAFQAAALAQGVAAVFVFPLHLGAVAFGTLELFAARPGSMTRVEVWLAGRFAEIGVGILLDGHDANRDGSLSPGFTRAVDHRADVAQAQGMVMVDLGVGLLEAMALLRAHAFTAGLSLGELSRNVISGYVLPWEDGHAAEPVES